MLTKELAKRRRRRPVRRSNTGRVIGYVRVSTDEQAESKAGLEAQRRTIELEAERRGWGSRLIWVTDAGFSAKSLERPGMQDALRFLAAGEADVLVAAKIDRLSRSILDFATLTRRAEEQGWSLVALDAGFDMTTASGRMMVGVLAVFAEYERDLIAERTRRALAARRDAGRPVSGPTISAELRDRLRVMRADGMTFQGIADALNRDRVPTARKGNWYPSTVHNALRVPRRGP